MRVRARTHTKSSACMVELRMFEALGLVYVTVWF
jgi:hypothetical protein